MLLLQSQLQLGDFLPGNACHLKEGEINGGNVARIKKKKNSRRNTVRTNFLGQKRESPERDK